MPFVLVDTSVSLPATLSHRGFRRRFFVILAFGAITYEVEHRRLELDELANEGGAEGGTVRGLERAMQRITLVEDRRAALEELLPYGTPDDWTAVGSAPLFDEYERKLREIGQKLDPMLRPEDIPALRRQVEALCVAGSPPFDPSDSPALTRDPQDDPIVFSALLADADFLISDDKDIVPDGIEHHYEHGERSVTAMTFDHMMDRFFAAVDVDFTEIDGSWLALAYSAMRAELGSGET
jgi:predicted nucleic acid-binding protein